MNRLDILNILRIKSNWEKNLSDKELWSYCDISKNIKVGRQKFDWAIFNRNKNMGFYFGDTYKDIPEDLIFDLLDMTTINNREDL